MLRSCRCGGRFLINYPLKAVGSFIQSLTAGTDLPVSVSIILPISLFRADMSLYSNGGGSRSQFCPLSLHTYKIDSGLESCHLLTSDSDPGVSVFSLVFHFIVNAGDNAVILGRGRAVLSAHSVGSRCFRYSNGLDRGIARFMEIPGQIDLNPVFRGHTGQGNGGIDNIHPCCTAVQAVLHACRNAGKNAAVLAVRIKYSVRLRGNSQLPKETDVAGLGICKPGIRRISVELLKQFLFIRCFLDICVLALQTVVVAHLNMTTHIRRKRRYIS